MIHQPTIVIRESAQALLTDQIKDVVTSLLRQLEKEAHIRAVSLRGIEVYGFSDPEDDSWELVVREAVDLAEQPALDYWDDLSFAVEAWGATLPSDESDILRTQIAIEVVWSHGG